MKILVLGTGAQGTTVAKRLDEEPGVSSIICADYNMEAVNELTGILTKAEGMKCNAYNVDEIINCAQGVDLIVNALPLEFGKNVLDAALAVKANYQDFSSTTAFDEDVNIGWIRGMKYQFEVYSPKFEEIGRLAIIGTGSAPGVICCATRDAMKYLDTCDTIYNFVWEGVKANRFQPFWWSPETAIQDMSEPAYTYENGELFVRPPFEDPVKRKYDYMDHEVTFLNHCHDEPVQYALNADKYFKGCKNAYFKYAGTGMDFAEPLYRAGLFDHEEREIKSRKVVPFDVIVESIPKPPKFEEEIREIIEEGMEADDGCMVVEAYGKKDGKDILVENHVFAPGIVEAFERAKMTGEMYLTGQGGYLFSKMFINGDFDQCGLISSDMLSFEQVDRYFEYAAELGIRLETTVKEI
ncbi:MAG: saccharopine dehydrogenase NADP-binding domain-containing protein [Anaerovoracaceae bacterium]|nr:saccharopine dehydrogenase NADP-binding domain-containing protein [Anaerovoracaceae bacterium]